jgi:hypothetical protein
LKLRKHSNQVELDQFFKAINDEKIASQVITKSAFFQSRKQVSSHGTSCLSFSTFLNAKVLGNVGIIW